MSDTFHPAPDDGSAPTNKVLVVIVNYNGGSSLTDCVASVIAQAIPTEIVVVDNGSTDGSDIAVAGAFPDVLVRKSSSNLGFGAAINLAVSENVGETIVVLNPDILLKTGCLAALLSALQAKSGVVGPVLSVEASDSREAGWTINHTGMPKVQDTGRLPLYVPGCVMATSRAVFETVGGFDDRYFLFVEDVEFCWRALLAGFEVSVASEAEAIHEGGGSAEGGYLKVGSRYQTSELRVSLRERNDIALMIACAPWWWLPFIIPLLIGHSLAVATGAMSIGRPYLARDLVIGIGWNIKQLHGSLERRCSLPRSQTGCRNARSRFAFGPLLIRTIRAYGLPDIH